MTPVFPITALDEGEMTSCRVGGQELLVANVEGSFYAVSNFCSHAGQRLSAGRLDGHQLRCPLHRAIFDVRTGAVLSGPTGAALTRYRVLVEDGKVLVEVPG
jgi:nitrite reductase/ring-hydroxylating ferredoxin subunit